MSEAVLRTGGDCSFRYEKLREMIDSIQIVDDHGHPGFASYFEKVPKEARIAFAVDPFRTPPETSQGFPYLENLHYEAYEKIYGFSRQDLLDGSKRQALAEIYEQRRKEHLAEQVIRSMDLGGVETLLVNYVMPEELKGNPRLKFIPTLDPLVFPFDNAHWIARGPLAASFFGAGEYLLKQMKAKYGFAGTTFDDYLEFADRVIADYVTEGVAGFKLVTSYHRTMYVEKVELSEGPVLYAASARGDLKAYARLQDLLICHVLAKAVEYDLPVQFHTAITDNFVDYYDPENLAEVIKDPLLFKAKIVLLHGGYPRYGAAEVLALGGLQPNNVYIDISGRMMFANHPRILARTLRTWLEKPILWDKILYGSDTLWGERYLYTCARQGRDAVYWALEGMIDEGILAEETAMTIARKILRENSIRLYKLGGTA